uniref:(northern house mosquito) hypothetical protein n=1 Tax=Culex pipiens TaxID=7175 RepID=A0A8D8BMT3_CULPI
MDGLHQDDELADHYDAKGAVRRAGGARNPRYLDAHNRADWNVLLHGVERKTSGNPDQGVQHLPAEDGPNQHVRTEREQRQVCGQGHPRGRHQRGCGFQDLERPPGNHQKHCLKHFLHAPGSCIFLISLFAL